MFEINEEIVAKTIHCSNNHDCLSKKGGNSYCLNIEIIKCVGNKLLFVECTNSYCRYCMKYGRGSTICNCPVRVAIYNKYKR